MEKPPCVITGTVFSPVIKQTYFLSSPAAFIDLPRKSATSGFAATISVSPRSLNVMLQPAIFTHCAHSCIFWASASLFGFSTNLRTAKNSRFLVRPKSALLRVRKCRFPFALGAFRRRDKIELGINSVTHVFKKRSRLLLAFVLDKHPVARLRSQGGDFVALYRDPFYRAQDFYSFYNPVYCGLPEYRLKNIPRRRRRHYVVAHPLDF